MQILYSFTLKKFTDRPFHKIKGQFAVFKGFSRHLEVSLFVHLSTLYIDKTGSLGGLTY